MDDLKDWRGKPIEVGTRIVYPGRGSSSLWLVEAEVVEIGAEFVKAKRLRSTSKWRVNQEDPKVVKLTELHRVTVVY